MERNENVERYMHCCYEDMRGDASIILRLILNAYSQNNVYDYSNNIKEFFSHISEEDLNERYYRDIDWNSIVDVAMSAKSRKETFDYLERV